MLSLALIVKNEEKNLARCLSSAKGVWDELIIVDTGSTDKTVEIAKQYTDKVYHFDWIDDFAKARNFSFSKCTQPWIMWLDADDVLHPEDVANIKAEMPSIGENPTLDYIVMNYHYFVIPDEEAAKEKGWSLKDVSHATLARERIIRRTKATWIGRVHEHIPVDFARSKSIDASVWHMRDEEDRVADSNRNIRIMKLEVEERPTERNYYYLGQEYSDSGMGDEAVEAYTKAFEITKRIDTKFQAAFKIARIHKALGRTEEAIEWFFKALNYHVAYREPFVDLAQVYFDKRDFSKAIVWLEAALKISEPDNPIMIIQKEYYGWLPLDRLAKAYHEMKRFDEATETLKKLWKETRNPVIFTDLETVSNAKKATFKHPNQPVKLNLGCGEKPMPGFVNCDLFPNPHVDEVFSLDDIPYADSTVQEINSEHSLEHLPRLRAEKALREWARVLAPGGKLTLKVPDVELCCRSFVDNPQQRESWWLFTLYGIQDFRHLAADNPFPDEVNYGQIHYTGFTKDSLSKLLRQNGLEIDYIGNYDGWDTPSIEVRAHKAVPTSQKKIAFVNNSLVPRYLSYGDYWLDAFRVAGHQVDEFKYEEIHTLPPGYDLYFFVEVRYLPTQISDQAHPRLLYTTENPTADNLKSFDFIATSDVARVGAWAALGHQVPRA
jgi:glycosyltransferase involved in cell wall biosynthesis